MPQKSQNAITPGEHRASSRPDTRERRPTPVDHVRRGSRPIGTVITGISGFVVLIFSAA